MRQTKIGKQTKLISGRILWAMGSLPKTVHWRSGVGAFTALVPHLLGWFWGPLRTWAKGDRHAAIPAHPVGLGLAPTLHLQHPD